MAFLGGGAEVLDQQLAQQNGHVPPQHPANSGANLHTGIADYIDATPRYVGAMVLGAALVLVLLRVAGFRFSFGVGVGGAS